MKESSRYFVQIFHVFNHFVIKIDLCSVWTLRFSVLKEFILSRGYETKTHVRSVRVVWEGSDCRLWEVEELFRNIHNIVVLQCRQLSCSYRPNVVCSAKTDQDRRKPRDNRDTSDQMCLRSVNMDCWEWFTWRKAARTHISNGSFTYATTLSCTFTMALRERGSGSWSNSIL